MTLRDFTITASGFAEWPDPQGRRVLARYVPHSQAQEAIAALLVARGWAVRLPLTPKHPHGEWERCTKTISLKSINDGCGNLYVKTNGELRAGQTLGTSQRISARLRQQMLGDPDEH